MQDHALNMRRVWRTWDPSSSVLRSKGNGSAKDAWAIHTFQHVMREERANECEVHESLR